jgi:hypothetical protein
MNIKSYATLCLWMLGCAPGVVVDASEAEIAEQNSALALAITERLAPEEPATEGNGFPEPTVDPTMDPIEAEPELEDPGFPEPNVDPTINPVEPSLEDEGPLLPTPDVDPTMDPVEPEPEPEMPEEPDLGIDPYAEKTCRTEQRCHRVSAGTECTEQPQQCGLDSPNCTTVVKHCSTLYAEVCTPIEVCTSTN